MNDTTMHDDKRLADIERRVSQRPNSRQIDELQAERDDFRAGFLAVEKECRAAHVTMAEQARKLDQIYHLRERATSWTQYADTVQALCRPRQRRPGTPDLRPRFSAESRL